MDRKKDRWVSDLWIVDADGGRNRFLTSGSAPVWSPDGTRIAFLDADDDGDPQVFVRWMDAEGAVSQVTREAHPPRDIRWSPDSGLIAFTRVVPAPETWALPSLPAPPEGAEWTKAPRIVRRMHFRQDRVGFLVEGFRHLFVVPADGGASRQLTEGEWHVGSRGAVGLDYGAGVSWMPDGSGLVFDASLADDADLRYRESHLHFVSLDTGEVRQITTEHGPWAGPVVSPDGTQIAFRGYDWTEQTYRCERPPGDRLRRFRASSALLGPRPRRREPDLGAVRRPHLLHRRRPGLAEPPFGFPSPGRRVRSPKERTSCR